MSTITIAALGQHPLLVGWRIRAPLTTPVPVVEHLHNRIADALEQGGAVNMNAWHGKNHTEYQTGFWGQEHCYAGWILRMAGEQGRLLQEEVDAPLAALLILAASCLYLTDHEEINFYASATEAKHWIERCAQHERLNELVAEHGR